MTSSESDFPCELEPLARGVLLLRSRPLTCCLLNSTFEDVYEDEDVKGYVHSQQQLNRLIDEERQRMVTAGKEPRIVLMGFSQGESLSRRDDSDSALTPIALQAAP